MCPNCGSSIVYVGLVNIECSGFGCRNYKPPPRESNYGSWAWARDKQNDGYKLEWADRNGDEWKPLEEDLDDDDPALVEVEADEYKYRLDQKYYEYDCPFVRGSDNWARVQAEYIGEVRLVETGWEIIDAKLVV